MICLITNTAAHYRSAIYTMLDRELDCHFVFGDCELVPNMDTTQLRHCRRIPYVPVRGGVFRLKGALRATRGYDVLINGANAVCLSAWVLLFAARFRHQRIIHWDHGYYGREGRIKRFVKRLYFRLAHAALIYNDYSRRLMIADGIPAEKIATIGNALDYDRHLQLRRQLEIEARQLSAADVFRPYFPKEGPVLLFIGRLTRQKQLHLLLEALAKLQHDVAPPHLFIIGDGEMRDELEARTAELGIQSRVCFFGSSYDEEITARFLYHADLCVSPGNVGLTAIHAMTFGCPVISHNNFAHQMPEFETIVPEETGAYFDEGDAEALATTIRHWLQAHSDSRSETRRLCYSQIANRWTPSHQFEAIRKQVFKVK